MTSPAVLAHSDECLKSVRPELASIGRYLRMYAQQSGIEIVFVQGLRTEAQQAALYAQGRTAPGQIVTQAPTAESTPHGRGAALDFAIIDLKGQPSWAAGLTLLYERVGRLGEGLGLVSGQRFSHPDRPHLNLRNWQSLPFPWTPTGG